MASSSAGSSGSPSLQTNSGLDEDLLLHVMDQKKRKRMLCNRESARRSRMRKTKYLDDLTAEISQLRRKNGLIRSSLVLCTQNHLVLETENSVLRTQVIELTNRLNSIIEILISTNLNYSLVNPQMMAASECFAGPWISSLMNQPSMASPNLLQYYY